MRQAPPAPRPAWGKRASLLPRLHTDNTEHKDQDSSAVGAGSGTKFGPLLAALRKTPKWPPGPQGAAEPGAGPPQRAASRMPVSSSIVSGSGFAFMLLARAALSTTSGRTASVNP